MIQPTDITLEEFFRLIGISDLQPWQLEIMKNLLARKCAGSCHGEADNQPAITRLAQVRPKALPKPHPEKKTPEARALPPPKPLLMVVDEIAATEKVTGGGQEARKARADKKWTDTKLLELLAMFDAGKSPKQIADSCHENLANIYHYLSKAKQLRNDTRLIPADRKQLIASCRMMSAPITVLDNVVRCEGQTVDDVGLLAFTNSHRIKNKLPLYKLVQSA